MCMCFWVACMCVCECQFVQAWAPWSVKCPGLLTSIDLQLSQSVELFVSSQEVFWCLQFLVETKLTRQFYMGTRLTSLGNKTVLILFYKMGKIGSAVPVFNHSNISGSSRAIFRLERYWKTLNGGEKIIFLSPFFNKLLRNEKWCFSPDVFG